MPRSVLLRHDLPDGSWHYDWFLERDERLGGPNDRTLMAFRTRERPDEAAAFEAERMPDHRRVYLEYEGAIGGGRGSVCRIAEWRCDVLHVTPLEMHVTLEGPSGSARVCGRVTRGDTWRFEAIG